MPPEIVAETPEGVTVRWSDFPRGRVKLVVECGAVSITAYLSAEQAASLLAARTEAAA